MRFDTRVLVAALLSCSAVAAAAQDKPAAPIQREIIPGSELMTSGEREGYRQRMRGAKSPEEATKMRSEHTKQMQERARLRGLRLAEPVSGKAQ